MSEAVKEAAAAEQSAADLVAAQEAAFGTAETVETEATETTAPERKRKVFTLADKIKVVDCLRTRVEPFVDDSKEGLARQVAELTGVDMQATSLFYLVDELPELKLGDKLILKLEPKLLEQQVKELNELVRTLAAAVYELQKVKT